MFPTLSLHGCRDRPLGWVIKLHGSKLTKGNIVVNQYNGGTFHRSRSESIDSVVLDVYGYAMSRSVVTSAEVALALRLVPAVVDEALAELLSMGLVRKPENGASGFVAVNPDAAAATVLGPLEQAIREQHAAVERAKQRLSEFVPLYEAQSKGREKSTGIELIVDLADVRAAIAGFAENCQAEVLTSHPGGGRRAEVLEEAIGRDERMLRRGVRMRTLYQHTAQFSPGTRTYVDRLTRLGADVRTLDDRIMRFLVFDRRIAVVAVQDDSNAAVVVRDPDIVHFTVTAFELVWGRAQTFPTRWDNQELAAIGDELKIRIFRLLSEGLTDQVIAKRMGMSVRTCRRHIAEVMSRLGAESRFQAGYLLGTGGWDAMGESKQD
ncbi:LuxR C-terminal-related transcriptional regulator [Streptomyces murinus]|uniref:LuxR C-terminal-related transcriptional regulator n=1 Tax=Streptomyces murinus TaxID=33900 RepID=UPI00381A729A